MRNGNKRSVRTKFSIFCGILATLAACTSAQKSEESGNIHRLHRLILQNLQVRRPVGPGADPKVGPGGPDYLAQTLPNAKLDCDSLENLYKDLKMPVIRTCLNLISNRTVIRYRLRRLPVPVLVLDTKASQVENPPEGQVGNLPACILEYLSTIPVPREVFFQSNEIGELSCYSSRLNIEADDIPGLGVKWPLTRTLLRVDLPLKKPLETDQKGVELLASWSLSPFFDEESGEISSRLVPEHLCGKCYGKAKFYKKDDALPALWPETQLDP
jgi:hypothetical protein